MQEYEAWVIVFAAFEQPHVFSTSIRETMTFKKSNSKQGKHSNEVYVFSNRRVAVADANDPLIRIFSSEG